MWSLVGHMVGFWDWLHVFRGDTNLRRGLQRHAHLMHMAFSVYITPSPRGFLLHSCTHGLVAMTSASHAEGRQFDPGWVYVRRFCLDHGLTVLAQLVKMSALHVLCCVVHIQAARLVRHGEDMIGCLCFGTSAPCTSEMRNDHLERLFVHLGWPVSTHHWACV